MALFGPPACRGGHGAGVAVAAVLLLGIPAGVPLPLTMLAWFVLWALYLSIVNVGQTFYGFGWETLLLEAGFLAIFLGNDGSRRRCW